MMKLFDTHAHVLDERFDPDREEVLARARAAGVERMVVVGDAADDPDAAFRFAGARDGVYAAAGLHPHDASQWTQAMGAQLLRCLEHPKAVALGEIGLDYHYDFSPRDAQRAAFERQLDLAWAARLPVILHVREAHGDVTAMLAARSRAGNLPSGVMHCFSGSWESARQYLNMGLYISFSGSVTFKNASKLLEVARNVPAERLLVETDCPYLAPSPMRGQRNEPAFVAHTARRIAELRGVPEEELAQHTANNAMRLFGLREGD